MERSAVFVDVGYLLGAAGQALLRTSYRGYIRCEFPALVGSLTDKVIEHSGLPVLRVYWYDAAYNAVPTHEQRGVATIPGVKLRLGRMVGGRQKGVDSLIVRDLMTLARERAMATAYLVCGDEDVREGVVAAQDMGARVVLVGIPAANRAFTLVAEADEVMELPEEFWRPYFARLTPAQLEEELPAEFAGLPTEVAPAPDGDQQNGSTITPDAYEAAARDAGTGFAREWGRQSAIEELRGVVAEHSWRVPATVDRQLLVMADRELGFLRQHPELRAPLRQGFKAELAKVLAERDPEDGSSAASSVDGDAGAPDEAARPVEETATN
ncbi:MAG: NYN domain-containing protein [Actinomycetota bacterium]